MGTYLFGYKTNPWLFSFFWIEVVQAILPTILFSRVLTKKKIKKNVSLS